MPLRLLATHSSLDLSSHTAACNSCLARVAGLQAQGLQTSLSATMVTLSRERTVCIGDTLVCSSSSPFLLSSLTPICPQLPGHHPPAADPRGGHCPGPRALAMPLSPNQLPAPNPKSEVPHRALLSRANQIKHQSVAWGTEASRRGQPRRAGCLQADPLACWTPGAWSTGWQVPLLSQLPAPSSQPDTFSPAAPAEIRAAWPACLPGSGGEEIRVGPLCWGLGFQLTGSGPLRGEAPWRWGSGI